MIFVSGVISIVFQKNTLCTNYKFVWFIFARIVSIFALNGSFIDWLIDFFEGVGGGGDCSPTLPLSQLVHLCSSRQGITMGTCKTKSILPDLGIFTDILALSSIFLHIQHILTYFSKYFFSPRANQIVNIWVMDHLAIFLFQPRKKWSLQNF